MGYSNEIGGQALQGFGEEVVAAVCVDWATDIACEPLPQPSVPVAVALKGLEDATMWQVDAGPTSIGRIVCRVTGCKVACRLLGYKGRDGLMRITGVTSQDDETDIDLCPKRFV